MENNFLIFLIMLIMFNVYLNASQYDNTLLQFTLLSC